MKKTVLDIILGLAASGTLFAQDGDRRVPNSLQHSFQKDTRRRGTRIGLLNTVNDANRMATANKPTAFVSGACSGSLPATLVTALAGNTRTLGFVKA